MDLTQKERDVAKAAYHMGYKSANHIHGRDLSSLVENAVDLLIQISQGETTLTGTGAELRLRHTNCPEDIEAILQANAPLEQAIAKAVLGR